MNKPNTEPHSTSAWATMLVALFMAAPAFAQDVTPGAPPPGSPPGPPPNAPPPPSEPRPPLPPMAVVAPPPDDGGRSAKNVLFVEGLGNGLLYSINYERFVSDDVSLRIGFGYFGSGASSDGTQTTSGSLITVPVLANYYLGGINHKLQLGLGATFVNVSEQDVGSGIGSTFNGGGFSAGGTAVVGYRYIPVKGGFTFGIGFTPFFGTFGFIPWAGLSLGTAL